MRIHSPVQTEAQCCESGFFFHLWIHILNLTSFIYSVLRREKIYRYYFSLMRTQSQHAYSSAPCQQFPMGRTLTKKNTLEQLLTFLTSIMLNFEQCCGTAPKWRLRIHQLINKICQVLYGYGI